MSKFRISSICFLLFIVKSSSADLVRVHGKINISTKKILFRIYSIRNFCRNELETPPGVEPGYKALQASA